MKAVGYPRVSTMGQDSNGYSLEDQVTCIEKFCAEKGIELVAHFMEIESAATMTNRPAWKGALKLVYNSPDIEFVVITNLDRHSRSVLDAEIVKRGLSKRGKRLLSVQEQYLTPIYDSDPEFGDYLESAMQHRMVEAEQERKRIRRRVLRGKKAKSARGGWIGFRPPYEYDVVQGELVLNAERSAVVRLMRRLRKWTGISYRRIAAYLNAKEIPPPHARKTLRDRQRPPLRGTGLWTDSSVFNLLKTNSDRDWGAESGRKGLVKAV